MNQEQLLDELQRERNKFTRADTDRMLALIEQIDYPTPRNQGIIDMVKKHGSLTPHIDSILAMVEGHGSRWHIYQEPLNCPHCDVDLCDNEHGAPYKRELAVYDLQRDRTSHFICPDCNGIIERL